MLDGQAEGHDIVAADDEAGVALAFSWHDEMVDLARARSFARGEGGVIRAPEPDVVEDDLRTFDVGQGSKGAGPPLVSLRRRSKEPSS